MGETYASSQIMQGNALFSGKIYTAGKIFTRPLVVTNFKSDMHCYQHLNAFNYQVFFTAAGEDYHVI